MRCAALVCLILSLACAGTPEQATRRRSSGGSDTTEDTAATADTAQDSGNAATVTYQLAWTGSFQASLRSYRSGDFGVAFLDPLGREGCRLVGTMALQSTDAPRSCPQCEWSFDLAAPTDITAYGTACDAIEAAGYDAAWADRQFDLSSADWAWGFTEWYEAYGTLYGTNIVRFHAGRGWQSWGGEAGDPGYAGTDGFTFRGTASDFSWSLATGTYDAIGDR